MRGLSSNLCFLAALKISLTLRLSTCFSLWFFQTALKTGCREEAFCDSLITALLSPFQAFFLSYQIPDSRQESSYYFWFGSSNQMCMAKLLVIASESCLWTTSPYSGVSHWFMLYCWGQAKEEVSRQELALMGQLTSGVKMSVKALKNSSKSCLQVSSSPQTIFSILRLMRALSFPRVALVSLTLSWLILREKICFGCSSTVCQQCWCLAGSRREYLRRASRIFTEDGFNHSWANLGWLSSCPSLFTALADLDQKLAAKYF